MLLFPLELSPVKFPTPLVPEHFTAATGLIPQEKTCFSLKCVLTQLSDFCETLQFAMPVLGGLPRKQAYVLDLL